jgi:hypothetical protein
VYKVQSSPVSRGLSLETEHCGAVAHVTSVVTDEEKANLKHDAELAPFAGFLLGLLFIPEDGGDMFQ